MEKIAQLDNPTGYYLQSIGKGLAGGGTLAALVGLVHSLRAGIKERQEAKKELEPDENTIVLTLPPKKSEIAGGPCSAIVGKQKPTSKETAAVFKKQLKDVPSGQFSNKLASDEPGTLNFLNATLLAGLGSTAGYLGVNELYNRYRKYYLNKELERARREYIEQISPSKDVAKVAGVLDVAFGFREVEQYLGLNKQAWGGSETIKGMLRDYFPSIGTQGAAYLLLGLLGGTTGTAYLTKRVLDTHIKKVEGDTMNYQPPKVNRIVFRTAPLPPSTDTKNQPLLPAAAPAEEAPLTDTETNQIKAAFWIIHDIVSGRNQLSKNANLQPLFAKYNTSIEKIALTLDKPDIGVLDKEVEDALPPELSTKLLQEIKQQVPTIGPAIDFMGPDQSMELAKKIVNRSGGVSAFMGDPTGFKDKIISEIKANPERALKDLGGAAGGKLRGMLPEWMGGKEQQPGAIESWQQQNPGMVDELGKGTVGEAAASALWNNPSFSRAAANRVVGGKGRLAYSLGKDNELVRQMARFHGRRAIENATSSVPGAPDSSSAPFPTTGMGVGKSLDTATPFSDPGRTARVTPEVSKQTYYGGSAGNWKDLMKKKGSAILEKHSQLSELKDLIYVDATPSAAPDFERNKIIAQRALDKIKLVSTDPNTQRYLTKQRQAIIVKAIQQTLEDELANPPKPE